MLVTLNCGKVIKVIFSFLVRGAQQNHFWLKLGFCPNKGGRGLTQSQLFKTKITTIQNGDFVGILSHYGRGGVLTPKQNKSPKITNHKKGTFHEKIIRLKLLITQNKRYFFSFWGVPTFGEGEGGCGWDKIPTLTKNGFEGLP